MQFSLDRKRRSPKQNQCSASDSVGLIFTRSYRFTLLITTPTTTPSLVKTSLKRLSGMGLWEICCVCGDTQMHSQGIEQKNMVQIMKCKLQMETNKTERCIDLGSLNWALLKCALLGRA